MYTQGSFNSIRARLMDAISGLLFSATIVVVVGGTAAMCLQRTVLFA